MYTCITLSLTVCPGIIQNVLQIFPHLSHTPWVLKVWPESAYVLATQNAVDELAL